MNKDLMNENKLNFGEFIYSLVNDFYSNYILKSSKPQENQWTIISSIIMENNNNYKIICFSNGTKSLPNINYKSRIFQIFDCHSEILTLRCFKFFLLNTLCFHLDKENENNYLTKDEYALFKANEEFYDIFDYNQKNKKFYIKKGINFHLYISENPCGECSNILYNINKQQNLKEMTGSKTLEECLDIINKKNTSNKTNNTNNNNINQINKEINNCKKYYFRSKSIRSDFKVNNLSFSLSCTDKIMLRNILGYQGKYLSFFVGPIFIKSLIINSSLDNNQDNIDLFKNCIDYNKRNEINNKDNNGYNIPDIYFVNHKDEDILFKGSFKNDKNSLSFSTYWYFPNSIKKVDPSNGIKTGGNIKEIDKLDFLRVKISNYDLCQNIFKILINNKKIFSKYIKKIEKYIINNNIKNDLDYCDVISSLINDNYVNVKDNIINENNEVKEFIGKKREILKNCKKRK